MTTPLATDRNIDAILSAITGKDISISGKKANGEIFTERKLNNVSFDRRSTGIVVIGHCPIAHAIRSFNLAQLNMLRLMGEI